jgi:hypothetical protein
MVYLLLVVFGIIAATVAFAWLLIWMNGAPTRQVQKVGIPCDAFVKTYRRISMTQHRVLFLVNFPTGPRGIEAVVEGLGDAWLADTCALARPVRVLAHPDISAVVIQ